MRFFWGDTRVPGDKVAFPRTCSSQRDGCSNGTGDVSGGWPCEVEPGNGTAVVLDGDGRRYKRRRITGSGCMVVA
jgi:hypothetical protein